MGALKQKTDTSFSRSSPPPPKFPFVVIGSRWGMWAQSHSRTVSFSLLYRGWLVPVWMPFCECQSVPSLITWERHQNYRALASCISALCSLQHLLQLVRDAAQPMRCSLPNHRYTSWAQVFGCSARSLVWTRTTAQWLLYACTVNLHIPQ